MKYSWLVEGLPVVFTEAKSRQPIPPIPGPAMQVRYCYDHAIAIANLVHNGVGKLIEHFATDLALT